jgi:hypothetical protein
VLFILVVIVTGVIVVAVIVTGMIMLAVIVTMAARPVCVAVLQLFLRRGTHVDDLDVEHECLARERVIQI